MKKKLKRRCQRSYHPKEIKRTALSLEGSRDTDMREIIGGVLWRRKRERDPRRKGKEKMIRKGSGIVKRERRRKPFDQRGHWKKKKRRSLGRSGDGR